MHLYKIEKKIWNLIILLNVLIIHKSVNKKID